MYKQKLLSKKDTCSKLGVSGTTLEKLMDNDLFPKPIKFPNVSRIAFAESELDEYIKNLMMNHRGRSAFRGSN